MPHTIVKITATPVFARGDADIAGVRLSGKLSGVIVEIETSQGIVGQGFTAITDEAVVAAAIDHVAAPNLLGMNLVERERILDKLYWLLSPRGNSDRDGAERGAVLPVQGFPRQRVGRHPSAERVRVRRLLYRGARGRARSSVRRADRQRRHVPVPQHASARRAGQWRVGRVARRCGRDLPQLVHRVACRDERYVDPARRAGPRFRHRSGRRARILLEPWIAEARQGVMRKRGEGETPRVQRPCVSMQTCATCAALRSALRCAAPAMAQTPRPAAASNAPTHPGEVQP